MQLPPFTIWLAVSAVVVFAGFVQTVTGFGFAILSVALLCLFLPLETVIPVVGVFGVAINVLMVFRLRRSVRLAAIGPLLTGAIIGVPVGVYALASLDGSIVMIGLGVFMIAAGIRGQLARRAKKKESAVVSDPRLGKAQVLGALMAGFAGGVTGGAFSIPGPPVVVYVSTRPWERDVVRSTLYLFFLSAGGAALFGYAGVGMLNAEGIGINACVVPLLPLGPILGERVASKLPTEKFRGVMVIALIVLGGLFVARAFWTLSGGSGAG